MLFLNNVFVSYRDQSMGLQFHHLFRILNKTLIFPKAVKKQKKNIKNFDIIINFLIDMKYSFRELLSLSKERRQSPRVRGM